MHVYFFGLQQVNEEEKLHEEEKLPEKTRDLTVEKTNKSSNKIPGLAAFSSDSTTDDVSISDLTNQRDDRIWKTNTETTRVEIE